MSRLPIILLVYVHSFKLQKDMKKIYNLIILLLFCTFISSCESYLDEKSDKQLATPTTIEDFKALLYHNNMFLGFSSAGEVSTNDFYLTDVDFNGLYYESDKRLYTWQPDYVSKSMETPGNNWRDCYRAIYVCNAVLQGVKENNLSGIEADEIRGYALVYRAARYLDGVQIWAPVYDQRTANNDPGMVIRLDPDMNLPSVRSSVQQTYNQIIKDLNEAVLLLPNTSISHNVPTKAAACGLLARTYLIMGEYAKALENAEYSLAYNSELIDFNSLNPNDTYPIPKTDRYAVKEMIFLNGMTINDFDMTNTVKIMPSLYNLYQTGDLRKSIYFRKNSDGSYSFKGSHFRASLFVGISTGELMLIVAECNARLDNLPKAEASLNNLLIKRWNPAYFVPVALKNKELALKAIIEERRKELAFRGLRWSDIKRLNRDGAEIILTRTVNGENYVLNPNDKKYAIAIPEDIISMTKIPQNPR